jgi:predicted nuclease of predicted toxin-antitoxin system
MLRLAADENFNNDIVRGLLRREPGLDIVRIQDVGLSGADDPTVLEWAAQEGRVLLTHDVTTITRYAYGSATRLGQRTRSLSLRHAQASARDHSMNGERLLDGNEIQGADQVFTETSLPTFPYRYRGAMWK